MHRKRVFRAAYGHTLIIRYRDIHQRHVPAVAGHVRPCHGVARRDQRRIPRVRVVCIHTVGGLLEVDARILFGADGGKRIEVDRPVQAHFLLANRRQRRGTIAIAMLKIGVGEASRMVRVKDVVSGHEVRQGILSREFHNTMRAVRIACVDYLGHVTGRTQGAVEHGQFAGIRRLSRRDVLTQEIVANGDLLPNLPVVRSGIPVLDLN